MTSQTPAFSKPIRVVVADDSAFMRRLISDALTERGAQVVGVGRDGDEALALCAQHRPDVLSLDLAMPGKDGIGVLRELRRIGSPVAVVVVSAFSPAHGARAVDALAEGAVELVAKPSGSALASGFFRELYDKMCLAALSCRPRAVAVAAPPAPARPAPARVPLRRAGAARAVVIACSTGGPKALASLIPALPPALGNGAVIVQHMPPGFTASLATRLDNASGLTVCEARGGERLTPSTALVAPGGRHLRLRDGGLVALSDEPEVGGLRPRADITIRDAAAVFGERLLLVVLTGMGKDGLEGAREVKRVGGRVLVEAESTCTVFGMPRAVAEAGLADMQLPLHELHEAIAGEAG
jgi:two-component system, chemotaxis family, protein-glutamate methylesterase/glutaminase